MRHKTLSSSITLAFVGSLLLSACGAASASTPDPAESVGAVYTAAALTLTSDLSILPSATAQITATVIPSPTLNFVPNTAAATLAPVAYSSGSSTASGCDDAAYVSDVTIPDGTIVAAGESFTKTWSIRNTGTCTWTTDYGIDFYSGNDLDGSATSLTESVAPNETVYISVDMVAPSTTGDYVGYWRMFNASGADFGASVYVLITVTTAYTSTPTATEESTSTLTPTVEAYP